MIERKITEAIKNDAGKIIAFVNPVEWWSPRSAEEVINDIEESFYNYFIMLEGQKVLLKVVNGSGEKYIGVDSIQTRHSALDTLLKKNVIVNSMLMRQ
ncbi:MAG: hypothetical protein HXY50_14995 [Ignavibacteriaceae bacterium]|nr:hypothetical protein [Ignavibacteriaceae bacterium]